MSVSVLFVCLTVHDHIFRVTRPTFTEFYVGLHVTYGHRSVLH